jgi:hypothetical protein
MDAKTEEEVVDGLLSFSINGQTRRVPELKWQANRAWKAEMQATFARLVSVPSDTPDGLAAMLDAEIALVLAYDATHALGDLDDATETEIDAIYNGLVKVAFPLAASPTAVGMAMLRAVAQSAPVSSMSGPSPTGTSAAPTILKDHLPSAKSGSSGRKRRSAATESSASA